MFYVILIVNLPNPVGNVNSVIRTNADSWVFLKSTKYDNNSNEWTCGVHRWWTMICTKVIIGEGDRVIARIRVSFHPKHLAIRKLMFAAVKDDRNV